MPLIAATVYISESREVSFHGDVNGTTEAQYRALEFIQEWFEADEGGFGEPDHFAQIATAASSPVNSIWFMAVMVVLRVSDC